MPKKLIFKLHRSESIKAVNIDIWLLKFMGTLIRYITYLNSLALIYPISMIEVWNKRLDIWIIFLTLDLNCVGNDTSAGLFTLEKSLTFGTNVVRATLSINFMFQSITFSNMQASLKTWLNNGISDEFWKYLTFVKIIQTESQLFVWLFVF